MSKNITLNGGFRYSEVVYILDSKCCLLAEADAPQVTYEGDENQPVTVRMCDDGEECWVIVNRVSLPDAVRVKVVACRHGNGASNVIKEEWVFDGEWVKKFG